MKSEELGALKNHQIMSYLILIPAIYKLYRNTFKLLPYAHSPPHFISEQECDSQGAYLLYFRLQPSAQGLHSPTLHLFLRGARYCSQHCKTSLQV